MSIIKRRLAVVLDKEIIAAAVLIALFGGWLLVNFASGFNLPLYLAAGFAGAALTVVFPRSGIYAMVFLLLVFANFFSLQPLMIGNVEYKFYLIDIILTAIIFGIGLRILSGRIKIYLRLGDWLMIGWLALTAVYFIYSVRLWNGDAVLAFSSFKNYGFYSLLYFIAYLLLDTRAAWRRLAGFVGAGAAVIIGFIAYGLITGQGLWTEITPLSTAGSRILDFNHAFYLSLVIIGGLSYLAFNRDWKGRLIYWLLPIF